MSRCIPIITFGIILSHIIGIYEPAENLKQSGDPIRALYYLFVDESVSVRALGA